MPAQAKNKTRRKDKWYINTNELYKAGISRKKRNIIGPIVFDSTLSMKHRSSMERAKRRIKKQSLVSIDNACMKAKDQLI